MQSNVLESILACQQLLEQMTFGAMRSTDLFSIFFALLSEYLSSGFANDCYSLVQEI